MNQVNFDAKLTLYVPTKRADGQPVDVKPFCWLPYWQQVMTETFGGQTTVKAYGTDNKGQDEEVFLVSALISKDTTVHAVKAVCEDFRRWALEQSGQTTVLMEITKVEGVLYFAE